MAEEINELDELFVHIVANRNFLLSGGAGSGKTYSLVKVLERVFLQRPLSKVACITYTNVAVHEIKSRIRAENLWVSTIHDFLWELIKGFQKNLKICLTELILEDKISTSLEQPLTAGYFDTIQIEYKEWRKIREGVISHEEMLLLSERMFERYPRLADILADKFDYIFIDEYQDTDPGVIKILLEHLQRSQKKNVFGFFGDSMQSIYPDTIGSILNYVERGVVSEVIKADNRRNPAILIPIVNRLRTDHVVQRTADDITAPNFGIQGSVTFLYAENIDMISLKASEYFRGWDFSDSSRTKELYLTHNLIAPKAGFEELMEIYAKDRIVEFKNEILHRIKEGKLVPPNNASFGDVIAWGNFSPTGVKLGFIQNNPTLYTKAKNYPFDIFSKIYLDKDQLIGNKKGTEEEDRKRGTKRDALIRHLFHINECLYFYQEGKFNEFIRANGFKVRSVQDKIDLKAAIECLLSMKDNTIEEVIDFADETGIWKKDDRFYEFVVANEYIYDRVKAVKYREIYNLYEFVEGYTPFSTQHNIKGAEFDNVLVVMDSGGWNMYNFKNLLLGTGTESVIERTRKLFYVCCTRAKKNLVVLFLKPTEPILVKARALFGVDNVKSI
jgi:DNA helicase-2/ATP-dependent DNA helicase PcrA